MSNDRVQVSYCAVHSESAKKIRKKFWADAKKRKLRVNSIMDIAPWKYQIDPPLVLDNVVITLADYVGFVYEILEKSTGLKYIGIKKLWKLKRKKKGERKRERVQSEWRTYKSSSNTKQENINKNPDK